MKNAAIIALALAAVLPTKATPPPPPEPFEAAFARFKGVYIPECQEILRDLRDRLAAPEIVNQAAQLTTLEKYLQNLREDDLAGVQRIIDHSSTDGLDQWADRIVVDTVGFRRVLDEIVIEALAGDRLRCDAIFVGRLRKLWDQESYFSWRFNVEATVGLRRNLPNQAAEPSRTAITPPAGAGDCASGTPGSP